MIGNTGPKIFATIPHSGETIPAELTPWLVGLPEEILMCDVDRYVDRLYVPLLQKARVPFVQTEWHRYAGDLNRLDEDVDVDSVEGSSHPSGKFARGFHWVITTTEKRLMQKPMPRADHEKLVELIYRPFHAEVGRQHQEFLKTQDQVYHLDLHSMPSLGTDQHRDPGQRRADIVISDQMGRSCTEEFRDLVVAAYVQAGFKVGYNWPYYGGRITETYGKPDAKIQVIQIELNRAMYMNEVSKQLLPELFAETQRKLESAVNYIVRKISEFK